MAKKKEDPKWRIVKQHSVYSKKQGTRIINVTVHKDLTYQQCIDLLKREYPHKVLDSNNEMTVPGLLYPTTIKVK